MANNPPPISSQTMRDYFASAALMGLMKNFPVAMDTTPGPGVPTVTSVAPTYAATAWALADAMLSQR